MKSVFIGIVAIAVAVLSFYQEPAMAQETAEASTAYPKPPKLGDWNYMDSSCSSTLHDQIQMEFNASIVYLKYAAYFAQEKVNLPGFEKFFFHAADEEREHGVKLIEYALMRGQTPVKPTFNLDYSSTVDSRTTGLSALEDALKKEEEVTRSIRKLIKECEAGENYNDYHLVDYLTGVYLEEQHKGQRELAEKIATLRKMTKHNSADKPGWQLAQFLFDKNHM